MSSRDVLDLQHIFGLKLGLAHSDEGLLPPLGLILGAGSFFYLSKSMGGWRSFAVCSKKCILRLDPKQ